MGEKSNEIIDLTKKHDNYAKYDIKWLYERTPYAFLLGEIGKSNQTVDMLIRTLEFDRDPSGIMKHFAIKLLTPEICLKGIKQSSANFKYIPDKFKTEEICRIAIEDDIRQFEYLPDCYKTEELCKKAVSADGCLLKFVPIGLRSQSLCLIAVENNGAALQYVPREYKTYRIKKIAKENNKPEMVFGSRPKLSYSLSSDGNNILVTSRVKTAPTPTSEENALAINESSLVETKHYSFVTLEQPFYISDLHLEHQLKLVGKTEQEVEALIREKLDETNLRWFFYLYSPLIIGGDVASSKSLEALFYRILREYWHGPIIGVLGNHELWDNIDTSGAKQSVEQIKAEYRNILDRNGCILLENDLLICKDTNEWSIIDEESIMNYSDAELSAIMAESYYVMLGGLGFSGYAPKYNAEIGLYSDTVSSITKDKELSDRFRSVYEKVIRCAGDRQVVVITHTPFYNWGLSQTAPECIYLNGHTHHNTILKGSNGSVVFANAQIGYRPKKWSCKSFCVIQRAYNPFRNLPNGIYKVDRKDYLAANVSYGIPIYSFKKIGDILLVKNAGVSMFFFRSKLASGEEKTYLLEGATIHNTDKDLNYYYQNIPVYADLVKKAYAPYYDALCKISDEVKLLGGSGRIHGCIVDVDFFNHVYLNPIDGQVSFYYAEDMISRVVVPFEQMLENTGLMKAYLEQQNKGNITVINSVLENKAIVPEIMFGTEMYEPSKALLKLQYLVEDDIIRVWKDEVLSLGKKRLTNTLTPVTEKQ